MGPGVLADYLLVDQTDQKGLLWGDSGGLCHNGQGVVGIASLIEIRDKILGRAVVTKISDNRDFLQSSFDQILAGETNIFREFSAQP